MESSLKTFTDHFDEFADNSQEMRELAMRDRDYKDGDQLTPEEYAALKKRKQPPVIRNRIQKAVMKVVSKEAESRSDPKAFPRNPEDEEGADAISKALRYVADNVDLDETNSEQFEHQITEGWGGAIVEIEPKTRDIEVNLIEPDRCYWDIHSRRNDYSDSRRFGLVTWMEEASVIKRWPDSKKDLGNYISTSLEYSTFEDKPNSLRWVDAVRRRVMVMQEYYLDDNDVWREVFFCKACVLKDQVSPYLDDKGDPCNPIELGSSFCKRDGSRYGLVRAMIDLQDEVNKRGSKALHLLNVNQTMGEEGSVKNVNDVKREKAKADGHIELNPGALSGGRFQFVDRRMELSVHLQMMQEAKAEIEELSINAEVGASASGRSRELQLQDELIKIGRVFDRHRHWKRRIYRQIWARIKQFWSEEKWVRVTDDEGSPEFVGLNQKITLGQLMTEHAKKTGEEIPPPFLADPRMNQVVEVRNNVKELDVDIIIDESPNYITLQHELLGIVLDAAKQAGQPLPIEVVLDLIPSLPNKRAIKDRLEGTDEQKAQAAQQ